MNRPCHSLNGLSIKITSTENRPFNQKIVFKINFVNYLGWMRDGFCKTDNREINYFRKYYFFLNFFMTIHQI